MNNLMRIGSSVLLVILVPLYAQGAKVDCSGVGHSFIHLYPDADTFVNFKKVVNKHENQTQAFSIFPKGITSTKLCAAIKEAFGGLKLKSLKSGETYQTIKIDFGGLKVNTKVVFNVKNLKNEEVSIVTAYPLSNSISLVQKNKDGRVSRSLYGSILEDSKNLRTWENACVKEGLTMTELPPSVSQVINPMSASVTPKSTLEVIVFKKDTSSTEGSRASSSPSPTLSSSETLSGEDGLSEIGPRISFSSASSEVSSQSTSTESTGSPKQLSDTLCRSSLGVLSSTVNKTEQDVEKALRVYRKPKNGSDSKKLKTTS